jgi:hypothetical protein
MRRLLTLALLVSAPAFAGFSWRIQVTLDHTEVGAGVENESSFPVALTPSDASLKTVANGGKVSSSLGADILAYSDSACTAQLPTELESYDGASGITVLWVRISTLSYTANGSIYICTGNASPPSRTTGVWDSNFVGVWHFPNGTTLSVLDSTINANAGSPIGAITPTSGRIDGAVNAVTAGLNNYINVADSASLRIAGQLTISAWVNQTARNGNGSLIAQKRNNTSPCSTDYNYGLWIQGNGQAMFQFGSDCNGGGVDTGSAVPLSAWAHIAVTVNESVATKFIFYLDGAQNSTPAYNETMPSSGTAPVGLLNYNFEAGEYFLNGSADEIRISNIARSAGWISTEYKNQSNPGNIGSPGFATFGSWVPLGTSQGYQILM